MLLCQAGVGNLRPVHPLQMLNILYNMGFLLARFH